MPCPSWYRQSVQRRRNNSDCAQTSCLGWWPHPLLVQDLFKHCSEVLLIFEVTTGYTKKMIPLTPFRTETYKPKKSFSDVSVVLHRTQFYASSDDVLDKSFLLLWIIKLIDLFATVNIFIYLRQSKTRCFMNPLNQSTDNFNQKLRKVLSSADKEMWMSDIAWWVY